MEVLRILRRNPQHPDFGLKLGCERPDMSSTMRVPKRAQTKTRRRRSSDGIHVCPGCASILVQPVTWHEQGDGHWTAAVRS
jgi:hypothetical protein